MGAIADMSIDAVKQPFFDKSTYPVHAFAASDGVRIVPGGFSVRGRSYIGRGVICMPPLLPNVRPHVGHGTLLDSHPPLWTFPHAGTTCHISPGAPLLGL